MTATADLLPDVLERHRRELTGFCYRMLGSGADADDAVQETLIRAWRSADAFEGRSSARSWIFRIATNVCLDMLRGRGRRARPMEMGPAQPPVEASLERTLPERSWVSPVADERVLPDHGDPADLAVEREGVRLAFVAALQHLPPRQRASLILCEVLRWQAGEVAELLGTSPAAVNSALQRARATLSCLAPGAADLRPAVDPEREALLDRYVDAFERYDVDALVALLHEDAVQSMPPFAMWLRGPTDIASWWRGPGAGCEGSRMLAVRLNGERAFAQYRPAEGGGHVPFAIQVVETAGGRITGMHAFLGPELFVELGLPSELPAA